MTPRSGSSLKMAGLDLSAINRNAPFVLPPSVRKGVDTVPNIAESGKRGEVAPWSCEGNMIIPSPKTPEGRSDIHLRHKKRTEPGESSIHWGMKTVQKPDPGLGYGIKSKKAEGTEQVFRAGQKLGIAEYVQSRGEAIYETVRKEPLGVSCSRGHVLPEETKKDAFPGFGKKITLDEFDAKESIFPRYVDEDSAEDKAMYKRTHGSFDPGEMIKRNYEWPAKLVDKHFAFGATVKDQPGNLNAGGGAKSALNMDLEADKSFPRTRVVNRNSEDYRQVVNDQLGNSRNMLQGRPPVPAGHAFGLKSGRDNTHAGELVRGFYPPTQQKPDEDLGKCTVRGRRNFHTRRPFGVPSVRHDLEPPPHHKRSVASSTNYGDDHSAFGLIYPQKFGFRGVVDDDFTFRRPSDEIRSLLVGAGYTLQDQDFRMLWDQAVQTFGDDEELVSLEVMLNILGHWMSVTGANPSRSNPQKDALDTLLPGLGTDRTMLSGSLSAR